MSQPNILLITTDQQRFDTLNAGGNPHILTPNLNWLLDEGIHFRRCYTDSPICIAARCTIMNGLHGWRSGLTSNAHKEVIDPRWSLPGLLTRAGYQTRAQGKMHFPTWRRTYGFEQWEILEHYYRHMAQHPELGTPMAHGLGQNSLEPGISTVEERHSLTHWTVDRSIDFIETRDPSRPFFLWTSFAKPHPPFDPCRDYWILYQDQPVPDPVIGDWSQTVADVPLCLRGPSRLLNNIDRISPAQMRQMRRAYYALITQVDYNLGILFARLRETGLLENTWIFFTADHGEMLGDHHLAAKSIGLEGSAHIPLLVRPPGGSWDNHHPLRGTTSDALVCLADVFRTCLDLGGAEVPAVTDGLDLVAVASGRERRDHLCGACSEFHFVVADRYKYLWTATSGEELLFDLAEDPYEQRELLRTGAHTAIAERLRGLLIERLRDSEPALLREGRLHPSGFTGSTGRGQWPGHHSRTVPVDVLH